MICVPRDYRRLCILLCAGTRSSPKRKKKQTKFKKRKKNLYIAKPLPANSSLETRACKHKDISRSSWFWSHLGWPNINCTELLAFSPGLSYRRAHLLCRGPDSPHAGPADHGPPSQSLLSVLLSRKQALTMHRQMGVAVLQQNCFPPKQECVRLGPQAPRLPGSVLADSADVASNVVRPWGEAGEGVPNRFLGQTVQRTHILCYPSFLLWSHLF